MASGEPFSAANLATLMLESLPAVEDTQIRSQSEAVALIAHACFLAVGFRLIGLDEEHRIGSYLQQNFYDTVNILCRIISG